MTTKAKALRVTQARLDSVINTANRYFGVLLNEDQARQVIAADDTLRDELRGVREAALLDTYTRDYLIMAVIEVVLPGPPAVQDSMIFRPMEYWHWPCNGSDDQYAATFYTAFKRAAKEKGFKLKRGFPG